MTPAYSQWPGFPLPFPGRRGTPVPSAKSAEAPFLLPEAPDHHSQLEELLGHVRRCERWARLDDKIDLNWRLGGNR
ncbi:MAG: hypothetical protein M3Z98_04395 [Candidatus Dormibacteraeota bacterium]|nr:hypothetical protein [Candidatus Dormibacteraeota bacterium]